MSEHSSAVFANLCRQVPVNPLNKLPSPIYEQKSFNELQNETLKAKSNPDTMKSKKSNQKNKLESLVKFYSSIPNYSDINHLPNQEFYRRIENLKAKQKTYNDYLEAEYNLEHKIDNFVSNYQKQASGNKPVRKLTPETDSVSSFGKETSAPSRRSVRIESPKDSSSKGSSYSFLEDFGTEDVALGTQSLPNSPSKLQKQNVGWKDCGITIPKPFKMTIRDEEEKIVHEILSKNCKRKMEKPEMFKAHSVPIESKIPLFDKIMEDQEIRRQFVKERSKQSLKSQMKPFSFTKREEELKTLSRKFSRSSPQLCLHLCGSPSENSAFQIKPFKAKPVPKNLFSNYAYKKMYEDEFYRVLKKKIRAEELMKAASLPPSMAAREKNQRKCSVCPKSMRNFDLEKTYEKRKSNRTPDYQARHEQLELELEDLKNEFITTTPRPFTFCTAKRHDKKRSKSAKKCRISEYENISNKRAQSALEFQSVNRSNLAAVLRIQSARLSDLTSMPTSRKRMELDLCRKLEEQKLKDETRWREKVMRQKPVWQMLNYSHEDDLAMRLQMRLDEEHLRNEEHKHEMELMLGRVQQIPTLFERQSQVKPPKTKRELMDELYNEIKYSKSSKHSTKWDKLDYNEKGVQVELLSKLDDEETFKCRNSDSDED